ncbi:MAG: glycosyltransferase [Paramuribaculum sp.]|nr:glycosyltransferase [Paramuribaculum sp.]
MNPQIAPAPTDGRPLKVAVICQSDSLGGAAVVTRRLVHALQAEGVDASLLAFHKLSTDDTVHTTSSRIIRATTFMGERIGIFLRNGFSRRNLFKVSTASTGIDLSHHPVVRDADVIVLSWINQGMLSLKGIARLASLGKPIVWTMHDMWNITGICHHAYECTSYTDRCGNCQFLTGRSAHDLAHRTQHRKDTLYHQHPITFVAVSNWLAERARKSSLLRDADVRVIHNAFPVESFPTSPSMDLRCVGESPLIISMGAARLDDPIKGLNYAIDALNHLFDNDPELARKSLAVFFGGIKDPSAFDRLRFPYRHLGQVNDGNVLRQLYAHTDVVLSTSLYETLPGTLIEGMAAGAVPVSFGRGGQNDIFEHLHTGYMAEYKNAEDVAAGIKWALTHRRKREDQHAEVRRRFSSSAIASQYIALFRELLAK